jgi:hypothetical protein
MDWGSARALACGGERLVHRTPARHRASFKYSKMFDERNFKSFGFSF